ncbi:hypothetical protein, partial [Histophilus somni]|uniref:hypothetical protein n=1 Tax=Histophilus somni TaxID=731 RepID=UPI00141A2662
PVAINNLKSGLGLDDMKDKPDSQKNGLSLELVKKLVSNGISSQQGQKMTGNKTCTERLISLI